MAFGFTRTLPAITGSHSDFPVLLTAGSFPTAAVDGGASSILNGGGNLRAYTDDTKAVQLPLHIVEFVTGGSPSVQVRVKTTAVTSGTIYLEADDTEVSQPPAASTYGSQAVYSGYDHFYPFSDNTGADATGNSNLSAGTTTDTAGKYGTAQRFDGNDDYSGGVNLTGGGNITVSMWISPDNGTDNDYISTFEDGVASNRFAIIKGFQDNFFNLFNVSAYPTGNPFDTVVSLSSSTWQKLTFAYDGVNIRAFLNGVLQYTVAGTLTTAGVDGIVIGNSSASDFFVGNIQDYSIWKGYSSADLEDTRYNNEDDPVNWGTSSAWVDSGSGISVTTTEVLQSLSDSVSVDIDYNVSISVTESLSTYSDSSTVNVTPDVNVTASITETLNNYNDSSTVTITEAGNVSCNVTEQLSSYSDSITASISANVNVSVTEVLNSFLDSSSVTIVKDITLNVTETLGAYSDFIAVKLPANWVDKTPVTTSWTDKTASSTIWIDKG
ncbi:MAG: LamG-like jellyroll fold domain-containing protein [Marinomonas sp.]